MCTYVPNQREYTHTLWYTYAHIEYVLFISNLTIICLFKIYIVKKLHKLYKERTECETL
jgi:hypothetical protein